MAMNPSSLFRNILFFLPLILTSVLTSSSSLNSIKKQEENFARGLNFFPEKSRNEPLRANSGKEVNEKVLQLPSPADPNPTIKDLGRHAGYYPISSTEKLFYFFFESRNRVDDPVLMWLGGGPGCCDEIALFYENGPFRIGENLSLSWNEFSWDKASHLLYVDQPIGTGFSSISDWNNYRHNEESVTNDLYTFLQAFFKGHPDFAKNDFYIAGEAYAGHHIPTLAAKIQKANRAKNGIFINLKFLASLIYDPGLAIGNGFVNPRIQYQAYADYALANKLISKSDKDSFDKYIPKCVQAIDQCDAQGEGEPCSNAYGICNSIFNYMLQNADDLNYYDIRKKCQGQGISCYDFSKMDLFLNYPPVRMALGVGMFNFDKCSLDVFQAMILDRMRNFDAGIPALMEEGIKLLVYAGEYDLMFNWLGNSRWVHALNWTGQANFEATKTVPFVVDGQAAGEIKSFGPLTFLKVYNAGQMVPMDQPKVSLQMIKGWMQSSCSVSKMIYVDSR